MGPLEAGDLDEAFLYAGHQARAYLAGCATPAGRHEMLDELAQNFAWLAKVLEVAGGLDATVIRRRLGLQSTWEATAQAAPPANGEAGGYFAPVARKITMALALSQPERAGTFARHRLEELFGSGTPVGVEQAVSEYRELLGDAGHGLDDSEVERQLGS